VHEKRQVPLRPYLSGRIFNETALQKPIEKPLQFRFKQDFILWFVFIHPDGCAKLRPCFIQVTNLKSSFIKCMNNVRIAAFVSRYFLFNFMELTWQ
jgi:hypothetical protein